jgi:hypothetical protein
LVLTPFFFGKTGQTRGKRSSWWKTERNRPIRGRTERSTRSADGQKGSALIVGQQVRSNQPMVNQRIGRWAWRRRYSKKCARWKVRWWRVSP